MLEGAFEALDDRLNKAGAAIAEIAKLEENFQPEILFSFVNQLALEEYQ